MFGPLTSKFKHFNMKSNKITAKQRNSCSKSAIEMHKTWNIFKINTQGSGVTICHFEQVDLCIVSESNIVFNKISICLDLWNLMF